MTLKFFEDGRPMWTCLICNKHLDYDIDKSFDACPEHRDRVLEKKRLEKIAEHANYFKRHRCCYGESEIICPYCFESQWDWYECISVEDGNEDIVSCGFCEKDFKAQVSISYEIKSERISNESNNEDTRAT